MREVISHDRLDLERVGLDDHFFDMGGHSILAALYAARAEQRTSSHSIRPMLPGKSPRLPSPTIVLLHGLPLEQPAVLACVLERTIVRLVLPCTHKPG